MKVQGRTYALTGLAASVCLFASSLATGAQAGSASGSLSVTATVASGCLVSNAALTFGVVNPATGANSTASTNILVTCTYGTNFSVGLDNGQNASGSQRRMKGAVNGNFLSYNLFQDAANTTAFGASAGSNLTGQVGLGASANTIPVYGTMPSGQSASADVYADTVAITVSY